MSLTDRQRKILAIVVKEYIDTATPVGSIAVCQKYSEEISSATIRNELAALENTGYLTHPYTSAGRVPTDQGYRFYVDELMDAYRLTAREKNLVDRLQAVLSKDLNSLLDETIRAVQALSENYAAIVKTADGISLAGLAKMFYEPEFEDVQNIRKMMSVLDDKTEVLHLLDEHSGQETSIRIGAELNTEPLKNCSLIARDFFCRDERIGSLGIIGPTRMKYSKIAAAVDSITHKLDEIFAEL